MYLVTPLDWSLLAFLFAAFLCVSATRPDTDRYRLLLFAFIVMACVLVACDWLAAIRASQFAPHHIVSSINGQVVADFWTTNPMYLDYEGGYPLLGIPMTHVTTNYYWHVWSIFR